MTGFRRAAVIQARVIGALTLRELVMEGGRGSIPFVHNFIRPLGIIASFYLLGRYTGFGPQGLPLLVFVVTGYLTWLGFLRCFAGTRGGKVGGLLMFPHVTPLDVAISKLLGDFVIYTMIFVVCCCMAVLFEQAPMPADPLGVLLAFWSAIGLGVVGGLIFYSLGRYTSLFEDLFTGIRMFGHVLSGVFALATSTPDFLLDYLRWNPLFHSVEWLRQSWWNSYQSPIADPHYIALCLFFLTAIGLAFERVSRRREGV
jgi:capsular polysaccharide transport system permease protein